MDFRLTRALNQAGKEAVVVALGNNSEVLILPHGGRILGLFSQGNPKNFLWVNPTLFRAKTARKFFDSDQWHNSGGARAWLAPELDFYFPGYPDLSVYEQPRAWDAREYQLKHHPSGLSMSLDCEVRSFRCKQTAQVRLTRTIEPTANPLRFCYPAFRGDFAGYTLRSRLELMDPSDTSLAIGLWNLLQLPPGGEMIMPTYGRRRPTKFFGVIPKKDLRVTASSVHYRMGSPGDQKIGLPPEASTGRMGHFLSSSKDAQCVITDFTINNGGQYVDVPAFEPDGPGYCVEACSVCNERLGAFSEAEYHAPAIGGLTGLTAVDDVSRTWAYRGEKEEVASINTYLLGTRSRRNP